MMKNQKVKSADQINHDIKSLIASIKAYSQLLLKKTKPSLDDKTFTYIVRLDKQVDALIEEVKKLPFASKETKSE